MTGEELGEKLSAYELAEWRAYYDLEPFGDVRADYRTGLLASLVANMFKGKGEKLITPIELMLHQDAKVDDEQPPDNRESQQEMINALKGLGG